MDDPRDSGEAPNGDGNGRRRDIGAVADRLWPAGLVVWIAGFWWFPDGWWHLAWFAVAVAAPLLAGPEGRAAIAGLWADPAGRLVVAWAAWIAVATLAAGPVRAEGVGGGWGGVALGLAVLAAQAAGVVLLVAGVRGLVARGEGGRLLGWVAAAGAVAAAASLVVWYGVEGNPFPRSRLRDIFVYEDGLHPVLTGHLAGFGVLAAAACAVGERAAARRAGWLLAQGVLTAAVLFTHSRGAILAVVAGMVVFAVVAGPRRAWPVLAVFAAVTLFYQFGASRVAPEERSPFARGAPTPAHELVGRGDNGRLALYKALLARVETPREWIAGRGRLADRGAGVEEIRWDAPHPHSAYLATLLIGGVVGLAILAALVAVAVWRAGAVFRDARRHRGRDPAAVAAAWSGLLALGLVGLLFDGDDLMAIATIPRLEPLLFWIPWAALSGARSGDGH